MFWRFLGLEHGTPIIDHVKYDQPMFWRCLGLEHRDHFELDACIIYICFYMMNFSAYFFSAICGQLIKNNRALL